MHLKLVVDANILIAALIKGDSTAQLLYAPKLELYSPEYLLTEILGYKDLIKEKSGMTDMNLKSCLMRSKGE